MLLTLPPTSTNLLPLGLTFGIISSGGLEALKTSFSIRGKQGQK